MESPGFPSDLRVEGSSHVFRAFQWLGMLKRLASFVLRKGLEGRQTVSTWKIVLMMILRVFRLNIKRRIFRGDTDFGSLSATFGISIFYVLQLRINQALLNLELTVRARQRARFLELQVK